MGMGGERERGKGEGGEVKSEDQMWVWWYWGIPNINIITYRFGSVFLNNFFLNITVINNFTEGYKGMLSVMRRDK